MDTGTQISQYLDELAQELLDLQVTSPFHMLIAGGAYMLLQNKRRSTLDIDFALVELTQPNTSSNQVLALTVKRMEISGHRSTVPYATEFKQAVGNISQKHQNLPGDWINDEAAVYLYDDAPYAEGVFWNSFRDILFVYLPTREYILATKIAAYRPKDAGDIKMLIQDLNLTTREQAKALVDRFLLPEARKFWEVEKKLRRLFR